MKTKNKTVEFINQLAYDKKDHGILGLIMNYSVVLGFVIGCFFSIKAGVLTANIIGFGWMGYWAYTEYKQSKDPKRKSEFLDWLWNSHAHLQTLLPIDVIFFMI